MTNDNKAELKTLILRCKIAYAEYRLIHECNKLGANFKGEYITDTRIRDAENKLVMENKNLDFFINQL